jgi:hypothetical protein
MVDINTIKKSLAIYLETEMLEKINGWQAWVVGGMASIALEKWADIFNAIKDNPLLTTMEIIKDGKVNIELLYEHFLPQAKKQSITFNLPVIGNITLRDNDIEKLYSIIKEQEGIL